MNPDTDQVDQGVIQFRTPPEEQSPLDELVRLGAQRMLQSALEAEVQEFLENTISPLRRQTTGRNFFGDAP